MLCALRRRFTNCLALMVWVSVAWIAYEMYFKVGHSCSLQRAMPRGKSADFMLCWYSRRCHLARSGKHCLTAAEAGRRRAQVTDQYNEKWRYDWVISDFWYALNYVFLAAICFLFRPSFNSTRYAYSELEGGLFLRS